MLIISLNSVNYTWIYCVYVLIYLFINKPILEQPINNIIIM